jgi:hypothetical protein
MFLLIQKDKVIPDLLGRSILHSLDTVRLLGSRSLLVLYDIAVQFLVKGLLRFILGLKVRQNMPLYLLLPALRGRQVLSLRCVLRAVLFIEGLGLAVVLLVGLDDVSEWSGRLSFTLQGFLLRQQHSLASLYPVNTLTHIGLVAFLLAETVLRSGIRLRLIGLLGLEDVLRWEAFLGGGLSFPPVGNDGGHGFKQQVGFRL